MLNKFIDEATRLANKGESPLTQAEERRFAFLLSAISDLRAGKSIEQVNDNYRTEQLARLGVLPANVSARKQEQRDRLLAQLKEIGIKRGYRDKVLAALRPDLS